MTGGLVLSGALFAFGLLLVVEQGVPLWRGVRSERWPRADGRVVASDVAAWAAVQPVRGRYAGGAAPAVRYEYAVGGVRYAGDRVNFVGFARAAVGPAAGRYAPGDPVRVAYDPARPARAVLEPGYDGPAVLRATGAAAVLVVGAAALAAHLG